MTAPVSEARQDGKNAAARLAWHPVFVVILTALPVTVAFFVGFTYQCVRITVAACIEAYVAGRGPDLHETKGNDR